MKKVEGCSAASLARHDPASRVQGSMLRRKAQGSRLRFKDPGPRSRVQGPGSKVQGPRSGLSGSGQLQCLPVAEEHEHRHGQGHPQTRDLRRPGEALGDMIVAYLRWSPKEGLGQESTPRNWRPRMTTTPIDQRLAASASSISFQHQHAASAQHQVRWDDVFGVISLGGSPRGSGIHIYYIIYIYI